MRRIIVFSFLLTVLSSTVSAKRMAPKNVTPVVYNNIEFRAPHDKMGFVQAWDIKTNKMLWEKRIYRVWIKPFLGRDVQEVFITELSIHAGKLIIKNERGRTYTLDLKTMKVKEIKK